MEVCEGCSRVNPYNISLCEDPRMCLRCFRRAVTTFQDNKHRRLSLIAEYKQKIAEYRREIADTEQERNSKKEELRKKKQEEVKAEQNERLKAKLNSARKELEELKSVCDTRNAEISNEIRQRLQTVETTHRTETLVDAIEKKLCSCIISARTHTAEAGSLPQSG